MSRNVIAGILLFVLAALLCAWVPTSAALVVDEVSLLAEGPGFAVTPYGLTLAGGLLLCVPLLWFMQRRCGQKWDLLPGLWAGAGALVGARLLYVLTMLGSILVDLGGTAFLVQPWQGGYTMYGAILGGLGALWLYCRVTHRSFAMHADLLMPCAGLMLCVGRVAEVFTLQGMSKVLMEDEALARLPFALYSEYGDVQLRVYLYEALTGWISAMVAVAVLSRTMRRGTPAWGRAAEVGIALVSLGQILWESWRGDEFIRFGFVRLNMLAAAVVLAGIVALRVRRCLRSGEKDAWSLWRVVLLLATAGVVIAIEFALDKSTIDNSLLYAVMAADLVAMGVAVLRRDGRQKA